MDGVDIIKEIQDILNLGYPKYLNKYENKIKGLQKWMSRQVKGSKNYKKTLNKIEETYRKLKNARKKMSEEIVSKVIKNNDVIVTEDLNIKNMTRKEKGEKNLRKEILNSTFGEIIRKLEYKCKWKNKTFIKVSRYYASSQICNKCGNKDKSMKDISKREYVCKKCGNVVERDINSSLNLIEEGMKILIRENKLIIVQKYTLEKYSTLATRGNWPVRGESPRKQEW